MGHSSTKALAPNRLRVAQRWPRQRPLRRARSTGGRIDKSGGAESSQENPAGQRTKWGEGEAANPGSGVNTKLYSRDRAAVFKGHAGAAVPELGKLARRAVRRRWQTLR